MGVWNAKARHDLHLEMYQAGKKRRSLRIRAKQALDVLLGRGDVYGLEWGNPETSPPLTYVRDHFLLPYLTPGTTVVEIGPGGGRWSRYMLGVKKVYAVDFHQELLNELQSNIRSKNLTVVKNNGSDCPGVPSESVDFLFSFGAFVHFDVEIIDHYLRNIRALLKPASNVVIHYSDKTKPLAQKNKGFSENDPDTMRRLVERWFADVTNKQLRRGVHRSVRELEAAIRAFIDAHNTEGKPFVWTKTADEILASIARFAQRTVALHGA